MRNYELLMLNEKPFNSAFAIRNSSFSLVFMLEFSKANSPILSCGFA